MFNFWTVLYLFIVGIIAGYLARLFVRDDRVSGFWQTVLLGVIGSFLGGFGGYLLFGFDEGEGAIQPGGIIGSIVGAVVAVLLWRTYQRRR